MGQTASQIEDHIEDGRESLGRNLRELEDKVKSAADWRYQFTNHPAVFLGAAFGGGVLLAAAIGRSSGGQTRRYKYTVPTAVTSPGESTQTSRAAHANSQAMDTAMQAWENIKGALVGVAATRLKDYVEGIIPGFTAQYHHQADNEHKV